MEVAERGEERGSIEEGGQDRDEDEVRRQLELRDPGDEAEPEPADDEQDRVRDARPLGRDQQERDDSEDGQEREAVFGRESHSAATRTLD